MNMKPSTSKLLDAALSEAAKGNPTALANFGIERATVGGLGIPPAGYEWEERLTLDGDGHLRLQTRRSISDDGLEAIGEFSLSCDDTVVANTIELLRDARLDEMPRSRIEPSELRLQITLAAGGAHQQTTISLNDPDSIDRAAPLLSELDRLALLARENPVKTLSIRLEMPPRAPAARVALSLSLTFINEGTAGYWLTHPNALAPAVSWERAALLYGKKPEIRPGITPLPVELSESPLQAADQKDADLFWLGPGGSVEHQFTTTMNFSEPGTYLARATYSTYAGEDQVAGRARMRGCAFSNEVEIEVG
jgi:hypothetical protein